MIKFLDEESGEIVDDIPDGTVGPAMTRQRGRHAAEPVKRTHEDSNMTMALMLSLVGFFGLAGLQWIYLGKPLRAVVYFLTFGWFFFGTVYDVYQFHIRALADQR
jgi:hypothetical protein